jgi:SnoaL-like domain
MLSRPLRAAVFIMALAAIHPSPGFTQESSNSTPAAVVARYRAARLATMEENASNASVHAVLQLLTDSAVYEHPQARARIAGRASIGAGIESFLGATRNPRIVVRREIVTGAAVAAEEHLTFELKEEGGNWVSHSRTQLSVYIVQGNQIAMELQYWVPRE